MSSNAVKSFSSILNASASFVICTISSRRPCTIAAYSSTLASMTAGSPLGPLFGFMSCQRLIAPLIFPRRSSTCLVIWPANCPFWSSKWASNLCNWVVKPSHAVVTSPNSTTANSASRPPPAIWRNNRFFSSMRRFKVITSPNLFTNPLASCPALPMSSTVMAWRSNKSLPSWTKVSTSSFSAKALRRSEETRVFCSCFISSSMEDFRGAKLMV
mmetsp:Transcript_6346/g.12335  ORF Transcript_6346/g.12335 Transcript_6346/m.12335 type:complete len:214 (-) Transcript_6346:1203-1844(-)